MNSIAVTMISLGSLLLLALAVDAFGRRTRLPRISLLVVLGFVLGPAVAGLIDPGNHEGFQFVAVLALSMVGFLVGGKLSRRRLGKVSRLIVWLSLWEVMVTFGVVAAGLLVFSQPLELALILATIATATDPAATLESIKAAGKSNRFSDTLTGIVAIDDAWCLILFSVVMMILQSVSSLEFDPTFLLHGLGELLGSISLGVLLGLPMAALSGRIRKGEPTLLEALGMVLLCAGLAAWLELSYLLACVCLGATVVNLARHHTRPFHAIEEVEWPFLALFFIFAGSYLTLAAIVQGGYLCLIYLLLRILGRLGGGIVAGLAVWVDRREALWMGAAMMPQGGVAMALAFLAAGVYPQHAATLSAVAVGAVFAFELGGPIATRFVLEKASNKSV